MSCKECGSFAINHNQHGRDGSDPDLCDVCFWRKRAAPLVRLTKTEIQVLCNLHAIDFCGNQEDFVNSIQNGLIAKNGGSV